MLHNDAGSEVVFDMNGSTVSGTVTFGNPGAGYRGAVTGIDVNGDGTSDVVLQGTNSSTPGLTAANFVLR